MLVLIGTVLDFGVWYYVKHLVIFDEEIPEKEMDEIKVNSNSENKNNPEKN